MTVTNSQQPAATSTPPARQPDHPVAELFVERWSPRAFTGEAIPDATLSTLFEAARWAASSYNSQPWQFVYAKREEPAFAPILSTLSERNQAWAHQAAALIVVTSNTLFTPPGKSAPEPWPTHAFDSGAAWANLALQAQLSGWHAHAMAGFDGAKVRDKLAVPPAYDIHAVVAIGRRGDKSLLPEAFRAAETPNGRKPIEAFVHRGRFPDGL
jgi:nitroreductase